MKHFQKNYFFSVPVSIVYQAITTQEGIRGWWTATCDVGTKIGPQSTFRFGRTYNKMSIESLISNKEVHWRCIEQYHHSPDQLARTDEWIATLVVFRLVSQTPTTTLLQFEHIGLVPELECYEICNDGWEHFIGNSLKSFVENGSGTPYREQ